MELDMLQLRGGMAFQPCAAEAFIVPFGRIYQMQSSLRGVIRVNKRDV